MCLQNKIIIHNYIIDYNTPESYVPEDAITCLMIKIRRLNRQVRMAKDEGRRAYFLKSLEEYRNQLDMLVEELRKDC